MDTQEKKEKKDDKSFDYINTAIEESFQEELKRKSEKDNEEHQL